MPLPFIAAAAGIGGLVNAFSSQSQAKAKRDAISRYQESLSESKYSAGEIELMKSSTRRNFNTGIENLLNRSAISTRGIANKDVVKAAAVAPSIAQAGIAEAEAEQAAVGYNKNIIQQIGQLEGQKPESDFLGDFFGGAVRGAVTGAQLNQLTDGALGEGFSSIFGGGTPVDTSVAMPTIAENPMIGITEAQYGMGEGAGVLGGQQMIPSLAEMEKADIGMWGTPYPSGTEGTVNIGDVETSLLDPGSFTQDMMDRRFGNMKSLAEHYFGFN